MNTNLDLAMAGQASAQQAEMMDRQRAMETARRELNAGAPKDKQAKLREACEGFESVFIQKMWEQMQATVPQEGYLHSKEEKHWQGMYNQELGKKMAAAGGIGLADMMMEQLGKNLHDASRTTATGALNRRDPLPIEPAPLLPVAEAPKNTPQAPAAPQASAAMNDLYSSEAPVVAEENISPLAMTMQSIENDMPMTETPHELSPLDQLAKNIEEQSMAPVIHRTIYQTNIPEKMGKGINQRVPSGQPLSGRINRTSAQQPVQPMQPAQSVQTTGGAQNYSSMAPGTSTASLHQSQQR